MDTPPSKEKLRELRRKAYLAAKLEREKDPEYQALKEASKQEQREKYLKQREQARQARKEAKEQERQLKKKRLEDKEKKKIADFMASLKTLSELSE